MKEAADVGGNNGRFSTLLPYHLKDKAFTKINHLTPGQE